MQTPAKDKQLPSKNIIRVMDGGRGTSVKYTTLRLKDYRVEFLGPCCMVVAMKLTNA
jgi:hypothetical protein